MSSGSKSTINMGSESAQNLISLLRSAFQPSEFDKVQQILVAREENLKRNINDMSKEIESWKKEFELMEKKKGELELAKLETEDELKKYKRECDELGEQVTRFREDQGVHCDRAKRAEERYAKLLEDFKKAEADKRELFLQVKVKNTDLECANVTKRRAEGEVEAWKKKFGELEPRVLQLEEDIAMLMIGNPLSPSKMNEDLKVEQPVSDEMRAKKETCDVGKPQIQTGARNSGPKESVLNCNEEVQREPIKEKDNCDDGESQKETGVGNSSTNLADPHIKESASNCHEKGHVSASVPVIEIDGLQVAGTGVGNSSTNLADPHIKESASNCHEKDHVSASVPVIEIDGLQVAGLNSMSRACDNEILIKKELVFEVESSDKLIGSSMGVNKKPESRIIIDINDSDDEIPIVKEMTKRKRDLCSNICLSEDDDDKKTLISKRKTKQLQQLSYGDKISPGDMPDSGSIDIAKVVSPSKQRPVLVERCREKIEAEQSVTNPLSKFTPDELSSDSEDSSSSGDETCNDSDINNILALLRKRNNEKWAFERDMLSAFERDPELCMNAICALYRQQSSTKKSIKGPLHSENRGFNQFDAIRGTTLAKFLIDGDPLGRLKKSVSELEQHDRKGLDDCRRLATRYSTQLFQIYQRKEDPFFPTFLG